MRTLVAALALTLQTLGAVALAEEETRSGQYWHRRCTSEDNLELQICLTYLMALDDGITLGRLFVARLNHCTPEGVTAVDLRKAVIRHLDRHPHDLHQPFTILILRALRESLPCDDTSRPRNAFTRSGPGTYWYGKCTSEDNLELQDASLT
jgi:hypothetical protein